MKLTGVTRSFLLASSLLPICACGGNSGNNSGGGNPPPPSSTEILFAADGTNDIFAFHVDQTSGALAQTGSVSPNLGQTVGNSSIAVTPSGTFLYAVNDVTADINCYSTGKSGNLALTPGSPYPILPGIQPSFPLVGLVVDPKGRFLYAGTDIGFGGIASFSIDSSTGALTATGGPFAPSPSGGFPAGMASPAGTFLYATDGSGTLWAFSIDAQTGALSVIPGSPYSVPGQGAGVQVDPSGHFVYVAMSNVNTIAAFSIDSVSAGLTAVSGSPFATTLPFAPYQLAIHPSGKFLYAINEGGNDAVAGLAINTASGALNPIAGSPFAVTPLIEGSPLVDPSGKFLYLAAGGISPPAAFVVLNINSSTGALTPNLQSPITGTQEPYGLAVAQFQ